MKSYKGFDKDLKCRGFQYEPGKTYELDKPVKVCNQGFHACEIPLEVFDYYAPAESRFCEVEQSGDISKSVDDSKVASSKITIGAEIGIPGLAKAHVEWVKSNIKSEKNKDKDCSASTNTGDYSASTNTGNRSASTNTGNCSASTNTGNYSASTNTGYRSASANTGNRSASTNTGDYSASTNTGDYSASTNTGNCSASTNTGKGGVAIVTGYKSKAKGAIGSALCICERGEWNGEEYPLLAIKAAIIDGEILKPDTWYTLVNGEFKEVNE